MKRVVWYFEEGGMAVDVRGTIAGGLECFGAGNVTYVWYFEEGVVVL